MKNKLLYFIVVSIIISVFALAVNAEIAEYFPDDTTGKYELTYSGAVPETNYLVVVLEGTFDEDYVFDLTDMSDKNIIYYNSFVSDENGDIAMSLVPLEYADATMFIGGAGFDAPKVVCYLKQGDALTVGDFDIVQTANENNEYYVDGVGSSDVYVNFKINAVDSFGYETTVPADELQRGLVDYHGNGIEFVENANAISLSPTLEEGTYKFSVTYGDITKVASFTVKHRTPTAKDIVVTLNGRKTSYTTITSKNTLDGVMLTPEKVVLEVVINDQYLQPMQDLEYSFKITRNGKTLKTIKNETGIYDFTPEETVSLDETDEYKIQVSSPDVSSTFKKEVTIYVTGVSAYEGEADTFFGYLIQVKEFVEKIESGEIKISESGGADVHYEDLWTTADQVAKLKAAYNTGLEILAKIDAGTIADSDITKAKEDILKAKNNFDSNTFYGKDKPIEELTFINDSFDTEVDNGQAIKVLRLATGTQANVVVTPYPSRPTEKPIYYSENPEIATVNANTGAVNALTPGETKIYAQNTDGSIKDSYKLVVYTPITSIAYTNKEIHLLNGEKYTPELVVAPENTGEDRYFAQIYYASDNEKVVSVDENGEITAKRTGSAIVTARAENGKYTRIDIKVTEPGISAAKEFIAKPAKPAVPGTDGAEGTPAQSGTKLTLPLEIISGKGISKLVVTVRFEDNVFKFNSAADTGLAGGYVETVDDGVTNKNRKIVSTWDNVRFDGKDSGKLIEYDIEVLEVDISDDEVKEKTVNFDVEAYTADGDKITWSTSSAKTKILIGKKDTYTVKVVADKGGTVGGDVGELECYIGDKLSVTAYPGSSYTFSGWYSDATKLSTDKDFTFEVTGTMTVIAKFAVSGGGGGGGGGGDRPIAPAQPQIDVKQVSKITSNVPNGVTAYGTEVTLSTTTIGAEIYYTLDGTPPTTRSTLYTAPIVIKSESMTITAVAVKSGMTSSEVVRFTFRVEDFPKETPPSKELRSYAAHIKYAPVNGTYFRPNEYATRYEIIEMLDFLFIVSGGLPEFEPFPDVSDKYKALVEKYAKAKVINGYPDGTFKGESGITRAEFVKLLAELLNMDVTGNVQYNVSLSDITGHWAENHIKAFVSAGYIIGYPEGDFKPDNSITRAEAVTILNRITGVKKQKVEKQYFVDVPSTFWAYDDIMNAANIPVVTEAINAENVSAPAEPK